MMLLRPNACHCGLEELKDFGFTTQLKLQLFALIHQAQIHGQGLKAVEGPLGKAPGGVLAELTIDRLPGGRMKPS